MRREKSLADRELAHFGCVLHKSLPTLTYRCSHAGKGIACWQNARQGMVCNGCAHGDCLRFKGRAQILGSDMTTRVGQLLAQ
ncbi:hypothetical protein ABZP12_04603 (plasmid) [Xanthomonas euvesicatoria]